MRIHLPSLVRPFLLATGLLTSFSSAVPTLDPPPSLSPVSPAGRASPDVVLASDVELFPVVLASTLSGGLHALDRETGKERWVIPPALPVNEHERAAAAHEDEDEDDLAEGAEKFLVDPREGMVYLATKRSSDWQVKQLGVTVPDLVQASFHSSPVHFASDPNPSRLFVGSQSTALIAIDMRSGEVVNGVESGSTGSSRKAAARQTALEDLLDGLEGDDEDAGQILWLTRTDYTLQVHTPTSPATPSQSLHYSTFSPRTSPEHPSSIFSLPYSLDSRYVQFATTPGQTGLLGLVETSSATFEAIWTQGFGAELPVGVWDVFVLRETGGLFVSRQANVRKEAIPSLPGGGRSGVLVIRGGGTMGRGFVALSKESFPLLGVAGNLPALSAKLEGWHPGGATPALEEAAVQTRDVWGAQFGEGVAKAVERRMIEAGESGPSNVSGEAEADKVTVYHEGVVRRVLRWIGVLALCSAIAYLGRLATSPASSAPGSLASKIEQSPAPPGRFAFPSAASQIHFDSSLLPNNSPLDAPSKEVTTSDILATAVPEVVGDDSKKKKRRQKRKGKKGDDDGGAPDDDDDEHAVETPVLPSTTFVSAQTTPRLPPSESFPTLGPAVPTSLILSTSDALTISDTLLGTGSHGTLVFKGSFQSRPVAVKRLLSHFTSLHEREITLLQSSDHHPNIIRYFYQEHREPWLLIALELCPCSLSELVERGPKGDAAIWDQWRDRKEEVMMGAVQGVEHLHSLKICHRDIKPQNILVTVTKSGSIRLLISDFGLAKQQTLDQSSFGATLYSASTTGHLPTGSPGWRAPELLMDGSEGDEGGGDWEVVGAAEGSGSGSGGGKLARSARLSRKVDVFALGCVIGWALSGGLHPFGERLERERNIIKNRPDVRSMFSVKSSEAQDLIYRMITFDSRKRPSLPFVLQHPCFWPPGRQLAFLQDASDRFEILERDPPHPWLVSLESRAKKVIPNGDWLAKMNRDFVESLGKYRKYDVGSLRDLLRALRNKRHHFLDLPPALLEAMSPVPEGFLGFWSQRFPLLLTQVYAVVEATDMVEEGAFRGYFPEGRYTP